MTKYNGICWQADQHVGPRQARLDNSPIKVEQPIRDELAQLQNLIDSLKTNIDLLENAVGPALSPSVPSPATFCDKKAYATCPLLGDLQYTWDCLNNQLHRLQDITNRVKL